MVFDQIKYYLVRLLILVFFFYQTGFIASATNSPSLELNEEEQNWLKENPTINVAYDGHFPPYSFINDDNQLEGFAVDIFQIISKKTGLTLKTYPHYQWSDLYAAAKEHKVDIVATMVNNSERSQWFNFSSPYISKSLVIITQENDHRINHKDDLENMTIAMVKGYHYVQPILDNRPSIKPLLVNTILDALNAVSVGRADAAITFLGAGDFYRTKYLLTNLKYAAIYDKDSSSESIAININKPLLASIIHKALTSIPESTLQSLREKWLPVDYEEAWVDIQLSDTEKEWIKKHPVIRLGIDPEFAPFEYIENEKYQGMVSDYIDILNQRLNLNMQVVKGVSWKQATQLAKSGKIDILPAVGKTESRQAYLNFSEPYLSFHRVIVTPIGTPFIIDINDLKNQKVAVQLNSSHHGYLKEESNLSPVPYSTLKEALLALSGGEVDAFVGNVASTSYWIRKLNLTNLKIAAPVSKEVQSLHFAIRKDWPELVEIIQKGLDSISDKQREEITRKWTSINYDYLIEIYLILKIVLVIALIVIAVITWNFSLKKKVKKQTLQILHHAHYDQLTQLPNRFLIQDRLSQRIKESKQLNSNIAMLSIDLDEFKKINEAYGHTAGDLILKEAATRLRLVLNEGDSLGRLSGDQFLILLCDFHNNTDIAHVAQTINEKFKRPFTISNINFTLSASIGIAIYPFDGDSPSELLKCADSATHHAKNTSMGSYVFYTEHLNSKVSRQLIIEEALRQALDKNEIYMVFQPKVDATYKRISGFEALIRWSSDTLGVIFPNEFIPIAEKTNLIEPIGLFVIEQSLSFLSQLHREFNTPYSMAINISPIQFRSNSLVEKIANEIQQNNIDGQYLEIEITEGVLMENNPNTESILNGFIEMGIKLAMDDFGTGYSSMSNLRKFHFNTLKIDREFIMDLPKKVSDAQLVNATISMAHSLDMKVVAEGVETKEQSQYLVSNNCDYLQGWLFGKPMREDEVITLLKKSRLEQ